MRASAVHLAAHRLSESGLVRTPVVHSPWLSELTGADVWLKLENQQIEGSFKARGALHALMQAGVPRAVTASAGNHGRAMSFAARQLGITLTVFAPRTAPKAKLDPIRANGAVLELRETYDAAEQEGIAFARDHQLPFISAYNHPDVIAGAGTVGIEVLEDLPDVEMLMVPVGGGGLISGIALAASAHPSLPIVQGVEAAASPVFTSALQAGTLVEVEVHPTLADGLAGNAEPGSITFDIVRDLRAGVVAVSEDAIAEAMRGLFHHHQQTVEGAGAVGVAALLCGAIETAGMQTAVIVSGGNVDAGKLPQG